MLLYNLILLSIKPTLIFALALLSIYPSCIFSRLVLKAKLVYPYHMESSLQLESVTVYEKIECKICLQNHFFLLSIFAPFWVTLASLANHGISMSAV